MAAALLPRGLDTGRCDALRAPHFPVDIPQGEGYAHVGMQQKIDLVQGTLDMLVLRTLTVMGPLHGYGLARRIEQVSGNRILLNQGTIYASLVRLERRGFISAEWGASDNNRRARFYSITRAGRKQLAEDTKAWNRFTQVVGKVMAAEE